MPSITPMMSTTFLLDASIEPMVCTTCATTGAALTGHAAGAEAASSLA